MLPRRVGKGSRGSDFTGSSREGLLGHGLLGLSDLVGLGCDLRIPFLTTARLSFPGDPTLEECMLSILLLVASEGPVWMCWDESAGGEEQFFQPHPTCFLVYLNSYSYLLALVSIFHVRGSVY